MRRAEWMTVFRYGHLRSAPVVVDACLRTEWEPPTLRAALCVSTRLSRRLLDGRCPLRKVGGRVPDGSSPVGISTQAYDRRQTGGTHYKRVLAPLRAVHVTAPP